jgi:deazaflavin-dependent oxidoreductase (nitroreductase family)
MRGTTPAQLETEFFRAVNAVMEPLVRAGLGSPGVVGPGAIVVETIGRKSGRATNVPLLAYRLGELLVVSTVRGDRSQWVKNLAARPEVRYWSCGRPHDATALVIASEQGAPPGEDLPEPERRLTAILRAAAGRHGLTFALLRPRPSSPNPDDSRAS